MNRKIGFPISAIESNNNYFFLSFFFQKNLNESVAIEIKIQKQEKMEKTQCKQ